MGYLRLVPVLALLSVLALPLVAVAADPSGNFVRPHAGKFYHGNAAVTSWSPSQTVVVGGILVEASASATAGVARVEFLLDGVPRKFDSTAPYQWDWADGVYSGSHVLQARVVDANGAVYVTPGIHVLKG